MITHTINLILSRKRSFRIEGCLTWRFRWNILRYAALPLLKIRVFGSLALIILSLAACNVGDDYVRPDIPVSPEWSNSLATDGAWPQTDWWQEFQSPQLTQLIKQARSRNNDIGAAVARIAQANAQLRIAGGALYPTIDSSNTAERAAQSNNGRSFTNGQKPFNSYNFGLNASYELDFWGKNRAAVESAAALRNASQFDKETIALSVFTNVANTYFDWLGTLDRLDVAHSNLTNAERLLESLHNRFKQGLVSALDVAQQENLVAAQRAAIPPLELRQEQDKNALALLVGQLPEDFGMPQHDQGLRALNVPAVTLGLPSALLRRRPDVQNAEAQLIAANADITQSRAQLFPSLTLTTQGGYASTILHSVFEPTGQFWSIGAGLTQPIFAGGALAGQLDLSKARYQELAQNYHKAVLTAFSDVENALAATTLDAEQEQAQLAAMQFAQKAYQLTLNQWHAGTIDITTVLNTQRAMFSAQDTFAQAKLLHLQAIVNLYAVLGGGWQQSP